MIFEGQYECKPVHYEDANMEVRYASRPDDQNVYLHVRQKPGFVPVFQPILQTDQGLIIRQPTVLRFASLFQVDFLALCELLLQEEQAKYVALDVEAGCIVSFEQKGYVQECSRWAILKDIRVEWSDENVNFGRQLEDSIHRCWAGKDIFLSEPIISALRGINKRFGTKLRREKPVDDVVLLSRRKEEGVVNEQLFLGYYCGPESRPCNVKVVQTGKGDTEPKRIDLYFQKIRAMQAGLPGAVKLINCVIKQNRIAVILEYCNGGTMAGLLQTLKELDKPCVLDKWTDRLQGFVDGMVSVTGQIEGHSGMQPRYLYFTQLKLVLGQPMFITEKVQRKLYQTRYEVDYFAPEMKECVMNFAKFLAFSPQKMDIWSFGVLLYQMFHLGMPTFSEGGLPIFSRHAVPPEIKGLITACLNKDPSLRPTWRDINFFKLARFILPQQEEGVIGAEEQVQRTRKVRVRQYPQKDSPAKLKDTSGVKQIALYQVPKEEAPSDQLQRYNKNQFKEVLQNIRLFKSILRSIIGTILYIALFFLPFFIGAIGVLVRRGYFHRFVIVSADKNMQFYTSTTVLTDKSSYFLSNGLTFQQIAAFNCINDQFDPVVDPSFSFLTFLRGGSFYWWAIAGILLALLITALKTVTLIKAGFWTLFNEVGVQWRHWFAWVFNQLVLCSLLFAHFYLFGFFYFLSLSPCLSVSSVNGVTPYFDSSLYLILGNYSNYFQMIFPVLGVLPIALCLSAGLFALRYKKQPETILHPVYFVLRQLVYLVFLLLARVGLFQVISPSYINDPASILLNSLSSFTGLLGFIPQIAEIICLVVDALIEALFSCIERKATESDRFRSFFTLKKKVRVRDDVDGSMAELNQEHPPSQDYAQLPDHSYLVK